MKNVLTALVSVGMLIFSAAPAVADWDDNMDYKMHWPQLPNPGGWDVNITSPNVVADDFLCTQTGPIRDIHFWFSVEDDQVDAALPRLESVHASIHRDIPVGPNTPYSRPADPPLWERDFSRDEIVISDIVWTGDQGWADPAKIPPVWRRPDHNLFYQINIVDIEKPFRQKGTTTNPIVYWLDLSVTMKGEPGIVIPSIGWKTTFQKPFPQDDPALWQWGGGWNDDAVYWGPNAAGVMGWQELVEPTPTFPGISHDMAFVITPEPSTVAMLVGVGLMGLLVYVRRKRCR